MKLKNRGSGIKFWALTMSLIIFLSGCGAITTDVPKEAEMVSAEGKEQETLLPVEISMEDNYRTYYEVFVYSFFDGNGDGIGDLKGLTEKLDYINDGNPETTEDLGCNGIWLMPIMPSPSYHKYDVTDYYEIDPAYGTMDDFETLMEECNKRGIKVIIDLVLNHSSSEHPWFQEACSYLKELGDKEPSVEECPYIDYYHFSREKEAGYCAVPESDIWYYEAQFYYGMPDLNLYNEQLREEISSIVEFWLDKGVGGFRLDAIKEFESGANDANIEILTWFVDMVKAKKPDAYLVGEAWTDLNTYAGYYKSGIDSLFDFAFADSDGMIANVVRGSRDASSYSMSLQSIQEKFASYNPNYIDAPFYTNHDMGRSAGYYAGENSPSQTKLAGALNLLMTGSAFVYYGEELGMKGAGKDENKRAPMYFSEDKNAPGMCAGPADMDNVKMKYHSLEVQREDPYSIYNYYKKAIRIRNAFPTIVKGKVENLETYSDETLAAFSKSYEDEMLYIFCNISPEEREVNLTEIQGEVQGITSGLYVDENEASLSENTMKMPGYSVVLLK
ncbi:MAG: alpha-amylase family glycosyl hydrolase [Firmicutes bacterium]|nr:alpha-amylase family glycosyl hydrolase [Bacillota bacterium]